jgi:predicted ATPase
MALQAVVTNLIYRREWPQAQERAEALLNLSREHGFGFNSAHGATLQGRALAAQGRHEEAIASIRQSRGAVWHSQNLCFEGEAWLARGTPEEGLAALGEALEHIEKSGERVWEAEVHRVKAELLLIQVPPDAAEAEASLHKALEVARSQSAKSWELRAATALARLWQRQGTRNEARAFLAPIYDWFTEGFDTQDLKNAKALLAELAPLDPEGRSPG